MNYPNSVLVKTIAIFVVVLAMAFLINFIALAWTNPPGTPPTCPAGYPGCDAPINISSTAQTKQGNLTLPNLYMNATGNEGSIYNANIIQGYNDLILYGSSAKNVPIYLEGNPVVINNDAGTGNVGIGTAGPTSGKLVINSDASATFDALSLINSFPGTGLGSRRILFGRSPSAVHQQAAIVSDITNAGDFGAGYLAFQTQTGAALYERMRITSSGNVGIGTAGPSQKLNIVGNIRAGLGQAAYIGDAFTSAAGWRNWLIGTSYFDGTNFITPNVGSNYVFAIGGASGVGAGGLHFYTTGSTGDTQRTDSPATFNGYIRMSIDNNGNVGIGTTGPGAKLEVAGQVKITGGSPSAGKVLTSDAAGLASWQTITGTLPSGTSGQTLRHDGTNWVANSLLFNNGTNIGIGATGPDGKIDIQAGSGGTALAISANYENSYRWRMIPTDRGNAIDLDFTVSDSADTQEALLQLSRSTSGRPEFAVLTNQLVVNNGNVGIGTAGPGNKLDVQGGNIDASGYVMAGGTSGGALLFGGTTAVNGGGAAGGASFYGRPRIGDWGNWLTIGEPNGTNGGMILQITGTKIYTGTSTGITAAPTLRNVLDDGSGNVGIGTTGPGYKLDVNGTFNAQTSMAVGGVGVITQGGNDVYGNIRVIRSQSTLADGMYINYGGTGGSAKIYDGGTANAITVGTGATLTVPGALAANGGISVDGNTVIDDGAGWHRTYGATGWYNGTYGGGWYMTDASWIKNYNSKPIYITGDGTNSAVFMNGNVGIGTAGPDSKLDVHGAGNITRDGTNPCCGSYTLSLNENSAGVDHAATLQFHNSGYAEAYIRLAPWNGNSVSRRFIIGDNQSQTTDLQIASGGLFVDGTENSYIMGKVGIGGSPSSGDKLEVFGNISTWGTFVVKSTTTGFKEAYINVGPNNSLDLQSTGNRWVAAFANFTDNNIDNRIAFQVRTKGLDSTSLDWGGGNGRAILILQRDGTLRIKAGLQSNQNYMDLAEYMPAVEHENLEPGDVVVFDELTGSLRRSFRAYDSLSAGVISTKPGFVLGADDEDLDWGEKDLGDSPAANLLEKIVQEEKKTKKAALALSGRVPAKVDATNEAVKIGDILVTSDTLGYAMKADPDKIKEGMVIGRALQGLEKGEKGMILILVK